MRFGCEVRNLVKINFDFEVRTFFKNRKKMKIWKFWFFFEILKILKFWEFENLEKLINFEDLGKNRGRHQIDEVETSLGTKSQLERTKLAHILDVFCILVFHFVFSWILLFCRGFKAYLRVRVEVRVHVYVLGACEMRTRKK